MRLWIPIVLLALPGGCASKNEMPEDLAAAQQSSRQAQVDFFDSRTFDSKLSAALRNQPEQVTVHPRGPISLNDIPERLDKWLFTVQDGGGEVVTRLEETDAQRGAVGMGADVIVFIAKYVIDKRTFSPAKSYDVVVHHSADGLVRMVTFRRR